MMLFTQAGAQPLGLEVEEEEGAILAVVEMRNRERAADVAAELIALLPLARQREVVAASSASLRRNSKSTPW